MKHTGTIVKIQRGKTEVTLIVDIGMGLRGIELERELWNEILRDFGRTQDADLVGWAVEYDPEYDDLEITGPGVVEDSDDEQEPEHPEQA